MKLLLTQRNEEITTVRKSVINLRVDTGTGFKSAEPPVIELTQEPNNNEQIVNTVDRQGAFKKGGSSLTAYSEGSPLTTRPYLEVLENDRFLKSQDAGSQGMVTVHHTPDRLEALSTPDENTARYQFVARKFTATQEMVAYHRNREKRSSFELIV